MKKEELIGIVKRLLGKEDIEFLRKLDAVELTKLIMYIREKIGLSKGLR
jgi:hypothetical protein